MRVAALYDVHGNLPALEAVLAEVDVFAPDVVVVGGDVVPGPMPRACLERLLGLKPVTRFIHGNGETDVVGFFDGSAPARVPAAFHPVMRWVAERLRPADRDTLAAWPRTTSLRIDSLGDVLFCHATPDDDNAIFTRVTPEERLAPALCAPGADVVVCGHTHMHFDRVVRGTRVVNAGSVGMPFGETAAGWLALEPGRIEHRRTAYDLDDAMARIAASGYPLSVDLANPPAAEAMLETFEAAALEPRG